MSCTPTTEQYLHNRQGTMKQHGAVRETDHSHPSNAEVKE